MILERDIVWLALGLMGVALWYVFSRVRFGSHWSISLHVAQRRDTIIVFGGAACIAAVMLFAFFTQWLIPRYAMGNLAYIACAVLCLGLMGTGVLPHIDGTKKGIVHQALSWLVVVGMPLTIGVFVYSVTGLYRVLAVGTLAVQTCLVLYVLYMLHRNLPRSRFLYYQIVFILLFVGNVLFLAYFG